MDATVLAYFAGFFDGEGTVGLYNTKHMKTPLFRVCLCNNVKAPLELALNLFGGRIRSRFRMHASGLHNNWEWYIDGPKADHFLRSIRPYTIVKSNQIDVYLDARSKLPGSGSGTRTQAQWEALIEAEAILKSLKREVTA